MEDVSKKLLYKSVEAFMMAIEIYNKPSIKYRVEGFAVFICNAWELMIKAHMINSMGNESIYYRDKPNRTLSLENCISKVFTNDKDPLRLNLEKIIELRNTSTHFITEEYEMVYVPLFQSCILNFNDKMKNFHAIDMSDIVPQNFLTLSVSMKALSEAEIIAKYPEEIATKLLDSKDKIDELSLENNANFSIRIDHYHYLTKDRNKATSTVRISKEADAEVKIIRDLKDPNNTHKYTSKKCINIIKKVLSEKEIDLKYKGTSVKFNNYHFQLIINYYNLKANDKYCYVHKQFTTPQYSYSQQAIDFIIDEIKKDPSNILDQIKTQLKK